MPHKSVGQLCIASSALLSSPSPDPSLLLLPAPVSVHHLQRNAQFKHHGDSAFRLNVPEFTAAPGELVAIVGRVGAGKSSLFQAILGNMDPVQGTAETGGRVSFVPQNPWCQNLTLRDNILFGLPFDEEKYERVSGSGYASSG
jgi:ABC-type multidrug transport system fused ATPase/permease subunit